METVKILKFTKIYGLNFWSDHTQTATQTEPKLP